MLVYVTLRLRLVILWSSSSVAGTTRHCTVILESLSSPHPDCRSVYQFHRRFCMFQEAIERGWNNLIGRWDGPMSFRFLIQPAMAILFAIRAGLRDARQGEPPF